MVSTDRGQADNHSLADHTNLSPEFTSSTDRGQEDEYSLADPSQSNNLITECTETNSQIELVDGTNPDQLDENLQFTLIQDNPYLLSETSDNFGFF